VDHYFLISRGGLHINFKSRLHIAQRDPALLAQWTLVDRAIGRLQNGLAEAIRGLDGEPTQIANTAEFK